MSIPRRPVPKPAAPQMLAEPASPSGSISSLLSAYSRSSGESLIRSSDGGGDATGNNSSVATFSPTQESAVDPKNAFPLPPRSASLAPKDPRPPPTLNGLILPENKAVPPPPPTKDERSPPRAQQQGSNWAQNPAPASATPNEPGSHSRSSSQATSDLWVRRTARSNHPHEVPELKLSISHPRASEDSQVLPHPSRSAVAASHNSPARPLQPAYFAHSPADAKAQSPLPPIPSHPAETKEQSVGDKMGQRASKVKDKLNALRGGVGKHLRGSSSQGGASITSPLSEQVTPASQGVGGESVSGSLPSLKMQQGEEQGQMQTQQTHVQQHHNTQQQQQQQIAQQQQQQQQHQPLPPPPPQEAPAYQKPIASATLHAARSLPDMKSPVPQTNSERPPPISPEYAYPQDSPLPPQAAQETPSIQQKFPPRTSSTRGPPPVSQRTQPFAERGRPRAGSNATHAGDSRAPSVGPRLGRVSSSTSLVDYAPPPPRVRKSDDTVYREVIQDELPPPDPRALYFPQQTTTPAPPATVFKAPSVSVAHHGCFQKHGKMIMARNKFYPLSCMTCEVEDAELRWQCAWCRLRVCGVCMRLLQGYNRDLGKVLDHIASQPDRGSGIPESNAAKSERGSGVQDSNAARSERGSAGMESNGSERVVEVRTETEQKGASS